MAPGFLPRLTASPLQTTTYLLGIALFSIAFLVFLNSSISFVVTEVIGQKDAVGDAVGTLGFADELLALVACPVWGLVSDRIGVRAVAVTGYVVVGFSLIGLVKSRNVYPELLVGRLGFSVGGAACSTMVTAVLPAMVAERLDDARAGDEESSVHESLRSGPVGDERRSSVSVPSGRMRRLQDEDREARRGSLGRHGATESVSSELTITQTRFTSHSRSRAGTAEGSAREEEEGEGDEDKTAGTSQLAGFVGLFTGAGALVALALFLPLPAYLQERGQSRPESLQSTYYFVGSVALCVGVFIFVGLRNLPGEEDKRFSDLWQQPYDESTKMDPQGHLHTTITPSPSYFKLVKDALVLGLTDADIFLGYLGGFVARASSVGISLFIPLFVNAYFVREGLCTENPHDLPDIKRNCQQAYGIASALSGIAETAALICAPIFGYLGGRAAKGRSEWPLLVAAAVGVGGYVAFGFLRTPDFHAEGGKWAFLSVILIGISQIGSIVCSLGLLGRGINASSNGSSGDSRPGTANTLRQDENGPIEGQETAPLLPSATKSDAKSRSSVDRSQLKGSIAGIYSFGGGAGILILTKAGGKLFDVWTPGAPFFIMAIFNAVLLVAVVVVAGGGLVRRGMRGVVQ